MDPPPADVIERPSTPPPEPLPRIGCGQGEFSGLLSVRHRRNPCTKVTTRRARKGDIEQNDSELQGADRKITGISETAKRTPGYIVIKLTSRIISEAMGLLVITLIILLLYLPCLFRLGESDGHSFQYPNVALPNASLARECMIDFIADTGDGWDSTFAVAVAAVQPSLGTSTRRPGCPCSPPLPRSHRIVLGGDIVYPYPTSDNLQKRFLQPYQLAMPQVGQCIVFESRKHWWPSLQRSADGKEWVPNCTRYNSQPVAEPMVSWPWELLQSIPLRQLLFQFIGNHPRLAPIPPDPNKKKSMRMEPRPEMWAIPGNHDALDGGATFELYFLETVAPTFGWSLPQTSTYFNLDGCDGWLVFALQNQHAAGMDPDIDYPQVNYFINILDQRATNESQNLLIMVHAPFWLQQGKPGQRLMFLLQHAQKTNFTLRAIIAGDLHHYSRYSPRDNTTGPHLITAGGGGAFLHSTVSLPADISIDLYGDGNQSSYHLQQAYPSKLKALQFVKKIWKSNQGVAVAIVCVYAALLLCFRTLFYVPTPALFWLITGAVLSVSQLLKWFSTLTLDDRWNLFLIIVIQLCTHKLLSCLQEICFLYSPPILVGWLPNRVDEVLVFAWHLLLPISPVLLLMAWNLSGMTAALHRMHIAHIDDAIFSSLALPHYKNFLRIRLGEEASIYAIGIPRAITQDALWYFPDPVYAGLQFASPIYFSNQVGTSVLNWTELVDIGRL